MEYDFFCSLGGSCASSHQLKERRLRVMSLPFDWLFCVDPQTVAKLTGCFRCDFQNWLQRENLRELGPSERGQSTIFQCQDLATGYRFIHDFHRDPARDEEYFEVKEKYARRIERLYRMLRDSQRVAFLFDAGYATDIAAFEELRNLLSEKFGAKAALDFYITEFSSPNPGVERREGITVFRYSHDKHDYLYKNKSFEFGFLDDMVLSGRIAQEAGRNDRLEINRLPRGVRLIFVRRKALKLRMQMRLFGRELEIVIGNPWK